jgi:hypothetical protein
MNPGAHWLGLIAVSLSELFALWLIFMLWRSDDHLFFKVSISLLALIPFIGPLAALWIGHFPVALPPALQNRRRYRTEVMDRWRHVIDEKNPVRRKHAWREVMRRGNDDMPGY